MWSLPDAVVAFRDDHLAQAHVLDQLKEPVGFLKPCRPADLLRMVNEAFRDPAKESSSDS
jgi:hypothetical protein